MTGSGNIEPRQLVLPDRPRVKLVYKRSLYELYVNEHEDDHIRSLVEEEDGSVEALVAAHERHKRGLDQIVEALECAPVSLESVYRGDLDDETIEDVDLVVVAGGDGTLLDASHHVRDLPLMGINTDPKASVGFLAQTVAGETGATLARLLGGELAVRPVQRLEVRLNGAVQGPPILNDMLYCHECPAATSKYEIHLGDQRERQQSSGIWIATAAGSTAAIRSAGGTPVSLDDPRLQYRIREPYLPPGVSYALTSGFFRDTLEVRTRIRTACVFLDGPYISFPVTFGDVLRIGHSDHALGLVRGPNGRDLA